LGKSCSLCGPLDLFRPSERSSIFWPVRSPYVFSTEQALDSGRSRSALSRSWRRRSGGWLRRPLCFARPRSECSGGLYGSSSGAGSRPVVGVCLPLLYLFAGLHGPACVVLFLSRKRFTAPSDLACANSLQAGRRGWISDAALLAAVLIYKHNQRARPVNPLRKLAISLLIDTHRPNRITPTPAMQQSPSSLSSTLHGA
jgi:hypothetical protein